MFRILFALIVGVALGAPQNYNEPPAPYDYQYKVENSPTNTYFGHNENGDPTGRVTGTYYVLLPDGRLMTVNYVSDQNGYVPRISFQQNAKPIQG